MNVKMNRRLSNTRLKVRVKRKTNPELLETIKIANENENWKAIAKQLSGPTRLFSSINLKEIDSQTTAGDTVLIIGKVLSSGNLTKKVRIVSLSISGSAKSKLSKTKSEYASILDEIKINKKAEGLKIIK
jgi:ribosomal protein L18E